MLCGSELARECRFRVSQKSRTHSRPWPLPQAGDHGSELARECAFRVAQESRTHSRPRPLPQTPGISWDDAVDGVDRETPGGRVPRALRIARRIGPRAANDDPHADAPAYAELHCLSDFSFLRGASSAEDLFVRAASLGYEALAITDECSLAGIVRAYDASRATGVKLIVGSEFRLEDGLRFVLLVENMAGYARLCRLITIARRAAKGSRSARAMIGRRARAGSATSRVAASLLSARASRDSKASRRAAAKARGVRPPAARARRASLATDRQRCASSPVACATAR